MRTTNTAAKPQQGTGAARPRRPEPAAPREASPAETGPLAPRPRGRHRKPRPRKVLLAAGGLALAAGALSLVRLTSGTGSDGGATVGAESRPDPVVSGRDETPGTAAVLPTAPEASPSSPTALGGLTPSPVTGDARPAPSAPGTGSGRTPDRPPAAGPGTTTLPDRPNASAPPPRGDTPRPAPTAPAPPSRSAPTAAPAPEQPDEPKQPRDPDMCVPVIGLCVDAPADRR